MLPEDEHLRSLHNVKSRAALNTWIFGLFVFLVIESCALSIVVLIWMAGNGYL
jgi:hypothetical protein